LIELSVFGDAGNSATPERADVPSWDPPWIDTVALSWDSAGG
jgi:hypothetical protein